ncbi:hypothetical protein CHU94_04780 [Rhodoferax sp. TH121]|uniref:hypothetical protein n=1 Tax=Rhodoferax sp. TH121 TaxID=2022803 RepID=UPI000B965BC9|nr:hypothetical protein [Rhodoferax sp. TH121]OYQ41694.1 hypothetical protein CHU94_04780 [Rhodoferax sp. TH121]
MMSWFKSTRDPLASAAVQPDTPLPHNRVLSANAQVWRRLARDGYDRTAEQVRASQPAPLQRDTNTPSHR